MITRLRSLAQRLAASLSTQPAVSHPRPASEINLSVRRHEAAQRKGVPRA